MKYDAAKDQFTFSLKLTTLGTETVTVTLNFPDSSYTVTKSVTFEIVGSSRSCGGDRVSFVAVAADKGPAAHTASLRPWPSVARWCTVVVSRG